MNKLRRLIGEGRSNLMTDIDDISISELRKRIDAEENKGFSKTSQPKSLTSDKTEKAHKAKKPMYFQVRSEQDALDAVLRLIEQSPAGKINFADLGHRYSLLTNKTWKESAQPYAGALRHFVGTREEFIVDGDFVAKANNVTMKSTSETTSAKKEEDCQAQAPGAPKLAKSARNVSVAADNSRISRTTPGKPTASSAKSDRDRSDKIHDRGCAPAGTPASGVGSILKALFFIILLTIGFLALLHSNVVPTLSEMPALQPVKQMVDQFVEEWQNASLREQEEIDELNAKFAHQA